MENENIDVSLEEQFLKIENDQKQEIEKLKQELEKRDNLIKKYMTTPSTKLRQQDNEDNEDVVTQEDVTKVLKIIKSKRS